MSLDNQPDVSPKGRKDKLTKKATRLWLNQLASRKTPPTSKSVPLTTKQKRSVREPSEELSQMASPPNPPQPGNKNLAKRPSDRGWWIGGFLFGFIVGLALSLIYGWVLDPRPLPISPADLSVSGKKAYIRLIAVAFFHDEDAAKAGARLDSLAEPNLETMVMDLTERYIDEDRDIRDIRALTMLAEAFGYTSSEMMAFIATPTSVPTATFTPAPTDTSAPTDTPTSPPPTPSDTPLPTETPTLTRTPTRTPTETATPTSTQTPTRTPTTIPTPRPTRTPTPGPNSPYGVLQSTVVCDSAIGGLLKIYIRDRLGAGVPGIEIRLSWPGGRDTLFTGFKPDIDPGYADFQMEPDEIYRIELATLELSGQIPEVTINNDNLCPGLSDEAVPSWQIVFQQGIN